MTKTCVICKKFSITGHSRSFHKFPFDDVQRQNWMNAISVSSLPKSATICSDHFADNAYHQTDGQTSLKRLLSDVVPSLMLDKNSHQVVKGSAMKTKVEGNMNAEFENMSSSADCSFDVTVQIIKEETPVLDRICRICLATQVKMYRYDTYGLNEAFEAIIGFAFERINYPQSLCYECAHILIKSYQFRKKSQTAEKYLEFLLQNYKTLSLQNVQTIDRSKTNLASSLSEYISVNDVGKLNYDLIIQEDFNVDIAEDIKLENDELTDANASDESDKYEINDDTNMVENNLDELKDNDEIKIEYSSEENLEFETLKKDLHQEEDESDKNDSFKLSRKVVKRKLNKKSDLPKTRKRKRCVLNNPNITVKELTKKEQLEEILNRKESDYYKQSRFKCTVCYRGFRDARAYEDHILKHDEKSGHLECEICRTRFKLPRTLSKHVNTHHSEMYYCKLCSFKTTQRAKSLIHDKWHSGALYKCKHCEKTFSLFPSYLSHLRISHPSSHVCQLCGYSFIGHKGLNLHKQLKHKFDDFKIEEGPLCEPCDIRFASMAALETHMSVSLKHSDGCNYKTRPYSVPERFHGSENEQNIEKSSELPITCEQCDLVLKSSRKYISHFRDAHPGINRTQFSHMKRPVMCEVCGRVFQGCAQLREHMPDHDSNKNYKCDACSKSFSNKRSLQNHIKLHGDKQHMWACDVCSKQFNRKMNRDRHARIHTGDRPFKCDTCDKRFSAQGNLRNHVAFVHLKKPWPKRNRIREKKERNRRIVDSAQSSG